MVKFDNGKSDDKMIFHGKKERKEMNEFERGRSRSSVIYLALRVTA